MCLLPSLVALSTNHTCLVFQDFPCSMHSSLHAMLKKKNRERPPLPSIFQRKTLCRGLRVYLHLKLQGHFSWSSPFFFKVPSGLFIFLYFVHVLSSTLCCRLCWLLGKRQDKFLPQVQATVAEKRTAAWRDVQWLPRRRAGGPHLPPLLGHALFTRVRFNRVHPGCCHKSTTEWVVYRQ